MECISAKRTVFRVERQQHFNGFTVSMVMQTSASLSLLSWSSLPSLGVHSPHESIRRGFLAVSERDVNRLIIGRQLNAHWLFPQSKLHLQFSLLEGFTTVTVVNCQHFLLDVNASCGPFWNEQLMMIVSLVFVWPIRLIIFAFSVYSWNGFNYSF